MLKTGLYEQIINCALGSELDKAEDKFMSTAKIDEAEASRILAKYISEIIEKGLDNLRDKGGDIQSQIALTNKIVDNITKETGNTDFVNMSVDDRAEQLLAFMEKKDSIFALGEKEITRPVTSIAYSSLFTGAIHEPPMFTELKKEIVSSDRIDMLVSFIKWSGLRLIYNELDSFTKRGGKLRIITTSYMGATDIKAIEELRQLPNTEIKISYDTKRTRLHAKTYVFIRDTGFTTAYVGSSNLSNAAISSGLEWNIKVAKKDMPETIEKIKATFETYWNSNEFELYSETQKTRLEKALRAEKYFDRSFDDQYLFDITPYPYQQEILKQIEAERTLRGHSNNLIVAATGTGKTVISAFDYKDFCKKNPARPCRLLFVAHREEILTQSLSCFRGVLKDHNFGDLFVGRNKPESIEHLFISIQTLNSQDFTSKTSADFYDYIVVDEFHHAAADSYKKMLDHYKPRILLGLTATPERMDGKSILQYFDNRIAAEIRLPEAIERKLLSPFQYFGVTDCVDLGSLKWTRGGYDAKELSNLFTINKFAADKRAGMIIQSIVKYVTDINEVKGLGFCVSVEHAKYMSHFFNEHNLPAIFLTADSQDKDRNTAKNRLVSGDIRFIFVVDLYNEGVDIPEVNTVLFLRPTESLTVFLQQLGRGLRLSEGKECLTVLDFIGQANKKYNFEDKFAALLANTTKSIQREIKDGFISVPKGCYIQLERKAKDYILNNIRSSFNTENGLVSRIGTFEEDSGSSLNIENFTKYYHLDIRTIYKRNNFSRLCVYAGVKDDFNEPIEEVMNKAFPRICSIDSRRWISFLLEVLTEQENNNLQDLTSGKNRMLNMFFYTIWQKSPEQCGLKSVFEGFYQLKSYPTILAELIELLHYNYNRIDFVDEQIDMGFECPLDLHCTYTRDQILVAMDYMNPSIIREGVKWLPDKNTDIFFITLNKSDKDYSPTTMYNDYSINEWLFHWQSQSTTASDSTTGKRYINQRNEGINVLLFVRESKGGIVGTSPYTCLGLADYVSHEGSKPMNMIWKLRRPIPAKFLKKTNQLVVG